MSQHNKNTVSRWFTEFWGPAWNPDIVAEIGTCDLVVDHPIHGIKSGRWAVAKFMADLRGAFPDLDFQLTDSLLADRDQVAARWEGRGTHTGAVYSDFRMGSVPAASGRKMQFLGSSIFCLREGRIAEDRGQSDALTAMLQMGLIKLPEAGSVPARSSLPPGWNRMDGWPHRGV